MLEVMRQMNGKPPDMSCAFLHKTMRKFWCFVAGDQISDVTIQWNHTEMKRLGNLSGLASSAYLIQTEHDLYTAAEWSELENTENAEPVSNYWCIMMARKGDAYGYAIALNEKNYTKQDTIAFAKTVQYDK